MLPYWNSYGAGMPTPTMNYPQFLNPSPQGVPSPAQQSGGFISVNGVEEARAYPVAAGSSALLMDTKGNTFYVKSVDSSGMPGPLRIFDFHERTAAPAEPTQSAPAPDLSAFVTRTELEQRLAALLYQQPQPSNGGLNNESAS